MTAVNATFAACLTPTGSAALAVIGLCGPGAWPAARAAFTPARGTLPADLPAGQFWFGRLTLADGPADEAVLAAHPGRVELQVHGGVQIVTWLLESLAARGVVVCGWADWLRQAEADALRAAALVELARAPTVRTAAILLDQVQGALTGALSRVDAARAAGEPTAAAAILDGVLAWAEVGQHLTRPWRVVLAGAPNAGKSSLANALAGYTRSLVSPVPGTTRDVVTLPLALDGWPVELWDTAGLRDSADELERAGVGRAAAAVADADLCLWVLDATIPPELAARPAGRVLAVMNKADLPAVWEPGAVGGAVQVSAVTGEGLDELIAAVVARLVPEAPPAGAAIPFTPELLTRLQRERANLGVP